MPPLKRQRTEADFEVFYQEVAKQGFENIVEIPFVSRIGSDEKYLMFFNRQHTVMLVFETWQNKYGTEGRLQFSWKRTCEVGEVHATFGPSISRSALFLGNMRDIYAVTYDLTAYTLAEAMERFKALGEFISPWEYRPPLTLAHHGDFQPGGKLDLSLPHLNKRNLGLIRERMAMIPPEVRKMTGWKD